MIAHEMTDIRNSVKIMNFANQSLWNTSVGTDRARSPKSTAEWIPIVRLS
jgi:hypothetical protein